MKPSFGHYQIGIETIMGIEVKEDEENE